MKHMDTVEKEKVKCQAGVSDQTKWKHELFVEHSSTTLLRLPKASNETVNI